MKPQRSAENAKSLPNFAQQPSSRNVPCIPTDGALTSRNFVCTARETPPLKATRKIKSRLLIGGICRIALTRSLLEVTLG